MKFLRNLLPLAGALSTVTAIDLDINSPDSVKAATSSIAYDMMTYYTGNQTGQVPGILPGPCASLECYYWWEAGAMWGALINYWQYTGDESYQSTVIDSLKFQIGPDKNYNPPNQSKNMGVDDQDFWGFAAMEAAEAGIPDASGDFPSWLSLAQAVWNFQVPLWETRTCGGGFRWQVYSFNAGYNLKNTISNGGFFMLSARLARYTGNQTYADWAEKVYSWMENSLLFEDQDNVLYIWDNTDADQNCTGVQHYVWSYNYGITMMGSAMMYNLTNGGDVWKNRIDRVMRGTLALFFPPDYGNNIMYEKLCEAQGNCNNDQSSFKAYLSRWMAVTALLAPYTWDTIMPKLQASAQAAAKQCVGGANGRTCGRQWYSTTWDGSKGVGQQMSALAVIGATQITPAMVPLTANTGGNSKSDPNAGNSAPHNPEDAFAKITDGDRAGAAIFTILIVAAVAGLCVWIIM